MDRPAPAYNGKESYVFVSYSHVDEELVFAEVRWLQDNGFNVWWDEGISPGAEWRDEVTHALQQCSLILYFVTPDSVESGQCRREINFGLDQYHRPVLAVHLLNVELPDSLGLVLSDRQAILKPGLSQEEYERKLVTTIAGYLHKPLPTGTAPRSTRLFVSKKIQQFWMIATTALLFGAFATYFALNLFGNVKTERFPFQLSITAPDSIDQLGYPIVTPDGKRIVIFGQKDGVFSLNTREIDSFEVVNYEGTKEANGFFVSYDGNWLAYFNNKKLFKTRIDADGSPIEIAEVDKTPPGGAWGPDGYIYYPDGWNGGLWRILASGGAPEAVTQQQEGEMGHWAPSAIPGTRYVLFTVAMKGGSSNDHWVSVVDVNTGEVSKLFHGGGAPRYVESGHIVYSRAGTFYAVPFDPKRLQELGNHVPVLDQALQGDPLGVNTATWSVSQAGLLVYVPGDTWVRRNSLGWVNRDGGLIESLTESRNIRDYELSNDRTKLAMTVMEEGKFGIEILDLDRGISTKIDIPGNAFAPSWSTGDSHLFFFRLMQGFDIQKVELNQPDTIHIVTSVEGDEFLLASAHHSDTALIYFEKGDEVRLVAENSKAEFGRIDNRAAAFSANDSWLSYVDRDGEVYIARFPEMTNRVRISAEGGRFPEWSHDGSELFYASADGWMTSVPLEYQGNLIKPGQATRLFKLSQYSSSFEVLEDRFLLQHFEPSIRGKELHIVGDWFGELSRIAPPEAP